MTQYHVNPNSEQAVICKPKTCPFGGVEKRHFTSADEAKTAHDNALVESFLARPDSSLVQALKASPLPTLVTKILGEYLTETGFKVRAITPSGSLLYNTELPHRPRHDYDFVIFVDDDTRLERYKHAVISYRGEVVDFFIVPLTLVPAYARQGQILESYFAVGQGLALYVKDFERLPDEDLLLSSYFENLREYIAKHAAGDYPPARLQREHKHMLRWRIYVTRPKGTAFSPQLSADERAEWLQEFAKFSSG